MKKKDSVWNTLNILEGKNKHWYDEGTPAKPSAIVARKPVRDLAMIAKERREGQKAKDKQHYSDKSARLSALISRK